LRLTVNIRRVADFKALIFQYSTKLYPNLQTLKLALKPLLFLYIVSSRVYFIQAVSNIFGLVELVDVLLNLNYNKLMSYYLMAFSMESIGENTMQQRCVCFPRISAGIDITSHPRSARIADMINDTAMNVKAPVAAGPP